MRLRIGKPQLSLIKKRLPPAPDQGQQETVSPGRSVSHPLTGPADGRFGDLGGVRRRER
jgi:hypothetical protein